MTRFLPAALVCLVATQAPAGEHLGTAMECDDRRVKAVVTDPATGNPVIPDEAAHWVQTAPHGAAPVLLHMGATQDALDSHVVFFDVPPAAMTIIDPSLHLERRDIVVRLQVDGRYLSILLTLDAENRPGMSCQGGVLIPDPTPTPAD